MGVPAAAQVGAPDAIQYTPVLNTGLNWQLYNGPGFTGRVDIPKDTWFHLRLELTGAQGKLYLNDSTTPILVMDDLKSGIPAGPAGAGRPHRRDLLLQLPGTHDRRWCLGAASPGDARGNTDPLEPFAVLRCAGEKPRAPATCRGA